MPDPNIRAIWYRVLQLGEFFNMERDPGLIQSGGGSRYIEIPRSMTADTLRFFAAQVPPAGGSGFTIVARPIASNSGTAFPINIQVKAGNRLRISNQNRQATPNRRHPAWSSASGFPQAPNDVPDRQSAAAYFPSGGVRVFIGKLTDDSFVAGFTQGGVPAHIPIDSPLRPLWINSGVGGVVWDLQLPVRGL